ncbi:MAG: heavy metal translocating P-type ATPase [Gemmatimonadaceae bacterium]
MTTPATEPAAILDVIPATQCRNSNSLSDNLSGNALSETSTQERQSCELRVGGMDCPSCATSIERSLSALDGVDDVRVDVVGGRVRVDYSPGKVVRGDLASAIQRVGFTVEDVDTRRAVFTVTGLDCADEVRLIEAKLGKLPGVNALQFDVVRHRLVVQGAITAPEVTRAVGELGMTARADGEAAPQGEFWERRGRLAMTAASGALLVIGLGLGWTGVASRVTVPLLVLSAIAGGWFIVPRGLRAARNRALDMNFLMSVAAVGAGAIGQWGEAASALFLFAIAQLLETYSMDRARNAIASLIDLSPTEAIVRRDGQDVVVPVADVDIGETILIKPGQRIPLDGVVIAGRSAVDQAPITGESMPVDKETGADVFAGSINTQGSLEVRITKHVEDTTLARIIHAVEEAQSTRASSQAFVDRFATIYTPAVVGAAILLAIVPPLLGLGSWHVWLYRSLTMLVVACPCALVISTPVTIVSGLAGAARAGILIKGGIYLEHAAAVTVMALDKTGTLTRGRPAVTDVIPLDEVMDTPEGEMSARILETGANDRAASRALEVLQLAAAVERHSEHPLARAVLAEARARGVAPLEAAGFEALVARGARATVSDRTVYLGNERLVREHRLVSHQLEKILRRLETEGKTPIVVWADHKSRGESRREALGVIAIADQIRPEARSAISALMALGIRPVMLTGDTAGTAHAVARQLDITEVHAQLLPEDKVRLVRELGTAGERVAFVGDGVNDAPALATAAVGIAMGAAGTDVALETADVALMGDDLSKLPVTIRLSRTTLSIIKQNVIFSLVVKSVFLVLAVTGFATLWMAVAADMGASLAVVANGLRARNRAS